MEQKSYRQLINHFPITFLAQYFSLGGLVSRLNILCALSTFGGFELFGIQESKSLIVASLWMLSWNWEIMLYVETKLFFEDAEWFSCFLTLDDAT